MGGEARIGENGQMRVRVSDPRFLYNEVPLAEMRCDDGRVKAVRWAKGRGRGVARGSDSAFVMRRASAKTRD